MKHELEFVEVSLHISIALNLNLHTSKDHLLAAFEINAQLYNITIFDWKRFGLDTRLTEPYVVEEGTR